MLRRTLLVGSLGFAAILAGCSGKTVVTGSGQMLGWSDATRSIAYDVTESSFRPTPKSTTRSLELAFRGATVAVTQDTPPVTLNFQFDSSKLAVPTQQNELVETVPFLAIPSARTVKVGDTFSDTTRGNDPDALEFARDRTWNVTAVSANAINYTMDIFVRLEQNNGLQQYKAISTTTPAQQARFDADMAPMIKGGPVGTCKGTFDRVAGAVRVVHCAYVVFPDAAYATPAAVAQAPSRNEITLQLK